MLSMTKRPLDQAMDSEASGQFGDVLESRRMSFLKQVSHLTRSNDTQLLCGRTAQMQTCCLENGVSMQVEKVASVERRELASIHMVAQSDVRGSSPSTPPRPPKTKQVTGQNAAAMLAQHRQSIRITEKGQPAVPKRTTSRTKPAKRKRHEDYVAFHKHSCLLFSSLDGALAEMRLSTAPLSSSSSSCSGSPTSSSSSSSSMSKRNASIDSSRSWPPPGPITTDSNGIRDMDSGPKPKRPTIQRGDCTKWKSSVLVSPLPLPEKQAPSRISSSTSTSAPTSRQISSQTSLPIPESSAPTSLIYLKSSPKVIAIPSHASTTISTSSSQTTLTLSPRRPTDPVVIHWTSPQTRRREYAKIDAANSGVRLLLRRLFPRAMCTKVGGGRTGFWDEKLDQESKSDGDNISVRRFRLSVDDDENVPTDSARDIYRQHLDSTNTDLSTESVPSSRPDVDSERDEMGKSKVRRWRLLGCVS